MTITPKEFWIEYRAALKEKASSKAYEKNKLWTKQAILAAEKAIKEFGLSRTVDGELKTQREYLRLDLMGWERRGPNDWFLRVAFEHENTDSWDDELCKLCHVIADLRVLSAYWDFRRRDSVEDFLTKRLEVLEEAEKRVTRYPGAKWLFVFGPWVPSFREDRPFLAFTLVDGIKLKKLPDDSPLNPMSWL